MPLRRRAAFSGSGAVDRARGAAAICQQELPGQDGCRLHAAECQSQLRRPPERLAGGEACGRQFWTLPRG
eukprot:8133174-Pyramimonas_sp.AAC.1